MLSNYRVRIKQGFIEDESRVVKRLIKQICLSKAENVQVSLKAGEFITQVRAMAKLGVMQSFLAEYGLSTEEGVALMCLAEALLRVPDDATIDDLIEDKIIPHDWASHIGDSGSILVNASTWALMLTGKVLADESEGIVGILKNLFRRLGEPIIRVAVERVMREMGEQFVLGEDIAEAVLKGGKLISSGYTYSYDMLGEAALTDGAAKNYLQAYLQAIKHIASGATSNDLRDNPGISVKLSALHPRYEGRQQSLTLPVISARLLILAKAAAQANVGLNIDAEEANRLDFSLDIFEQVLRDKDLQDWQGFGLVVQAYGKRATHVLDWLYALAQHLNHKIMVRLVKGAYWDSEIKHAQVFGLADYSVFTRKSSTDVSYLACATKLMMMREWIYPQFATHNAHTIAAVIQLADNSYDDFEFQHLHGMGHALHALVKKEQGTRCRIYAPVGTHENLLAYLVRRLLENGANSSFVNQIVDEAITPEEIAQDPIALSESLAQIVNPKIVSPKNLFSPNRLNSRGWDLDHPGMLEDLQLLREPFKTPYSWHYLDNKSSLETSVNPADVSEKIGSSDFTEVTKLDIKIIQALNAQHSWEQQGAKLRSKLLLKTAELFDQNFAELSMLLTREAGKTLADGVSEIRESIDFLRYYAANIDEFNEPGLIARGVIVCISPWNFPLAIFTGQIAAALVTGNSVLAKPSEQTPLIAHKAVELMHAAGIPKHVLQLASGRGEIVGAALTVHPDISGVCFTGSTTVAKLIEKNLIYSPRPELLLIAETGGINAMVVDSTALLEQAVTDIIASAFQSAGQRCSALRMLYVQEDIRDELLLMLYGAMTTLVVGNPLHLETDIGPVIDAAARNKITSYCQQKQRDGKLLFQVEVPEEGFFVAPSIIEVEGIADLAEEIFGPVLHVASFDGNEISKVVNAINASGYGLTFGLHTRIDRRVQEIVNTVQVGNFYINRNQIGAVVGSQPFGGEGLSGTGPKAGGPHYLRRFQYRTTDIVPAAPIEVTAIIPLQKIRKVCDELAPQQGIHNVESLAILRKLLRGKAASAMSAAAALDMGPVDLPGPTGESNQFSLHPLGTVLCLADDQESLLAMVVQALRAGNKVIAIGLHAKQVLTLFASSKLLLRALDGQINVSMLSDLNIDAVAVDQSVNFQELRRALAQQERGITRLITEQLNPAAYTLERSICIDTTAAGGNTELLAG